MILQPIEEGDKVRAEIVHVLDHENIAVLMEKNLWPERFAEDAKLLTRRRHKAEDNDDSDLFPASSDSEISTDSSSSIASRDEDDEEQSEEIEEDKK